MAPMFKAELDSLKQKNRYRSLQRCAGIDLTSNDYLGMASHPALRAAAVEALQAGMDIGAAGSRLLRGHTPAHADLEAFAATHFHAGGALYFSSGFQANFALLSTLARRGDVILYDALIHASMRDGLLATKAKSYKFAHNDMQALEDMLKRHSHGAGKVWIAVESVYSMDGDIAPLAEIYSLAERFDAVVIADEAHATGIMGEAGKGACWPLIQKHGYDRLVTVHTCGKAIGVAGGLVCASEEVIAYMINAARPFIYSTAPMPLQAYLVQVALGLIASQEGEDRRDKLRQISTQAQALFGGHGTHIVPIILGEDAKALDAAHALQKAGYDVRAIRPPTVPEGSARLRLSLSSALQAGTLDEVANLLRPYQRQAA